MLRRSTGPSYLSNAQVNAQRLPVCYVASTSAFLSWTIVNPVVVTLNTPLNPLMVNTVVAESKKEMKMDARLPRDARLIIRLCRHRHGLCRRKKQNVCRLTPL